MSKLKHELKHLLRYAGSGVLNTLVGVSTILLLTISGVVGPFVANIGGYMVSLSLGFFISKKYVFFSEGHFVLESLRYILSFALCFMLNLLVLWLVLNFSNAEVIVAQLLAAGAYTLSMYLLTRWFVFKGVSYSSLKDEVE